MQWKCEPRIRERYGKAFVEEFEDLWVWSVLKMAMCFLCFVSCCSSLSYSSSLPQTSWGSSYVFGASVKLCRRGESGIFSTVLECVSKLKSDWFS